MATMRPGGQLQTGLARATAAPGFGCGSGGGGKAPSGPFPHLLQFIFIGLLELRCALLGSKKGLSAKIRQVIYR